MNKLMNRKRLLYDTNEDIYFFIYNILLILNTLECYSSESSFKDYRKFVFLITFISDDNYCKLFIKYYRTELEVNDCIRRKLRNFYYEGIEKIKFLRYVLLIMEKHNFIKIENEENRVNVFLIKENNNQEFFNSNKFKDVIDNINRIPSHRVIKKVAYKTFIKNIFMQNGVEVWED